VGVWTVGFIIKWIIIGTIIRIGVTNVTEIFLFLNFRSNTSGFKDQVANRPKIVFSPDNNSILQDMDLLILKGNPASGLRACRGRYLPPVLRQVGAGKIAASMLSSRVVVSSDLVMYQVPSERSLALAGGQLVG
jgi:hypothetical protein